MFTWLSGQTENIYKASGTLSLQIRCWHAVPVTGCRTPPTHLGGKKSLPTVCVIVVPS